MIRRRTRRRFGIWLASIALGLALFAPTISRVLYAVSMDGAAMAAMACDPPAHSGHGHPDMSAHAGMADHSGMPDGSGMPMNGDVCAYCTLMCHSPALVSALAFIVLPLPRAPYSTVFGEAHAPVPVLLDRRARGPPVA